MLQVEATEVDIKRRLIRLMTDEEATMDYFEALYRHSPGWIEKNDEKLQDNQYLGWDSNRTPPEYSSEGLPPELTCSLWEFCSDQFCKGRRSNNNDDNWKEYALVYHLIMKTDVSLRPDRTHFSTMRDLSLYGSTALCWALAAFFIFLIFYTFGWTP
jgi:hypothetical protein